MRFKILALFACLLGTISPLVQASALDDLCGVIESLGSCRTAVYVPQVKVRYGTIHLVKLNSCKSRISYGFGWTCWAGFDRWDVEGPVGVDFSVRAVSLCSLTQTAIPGLPDLVKRASGVCKCLPEAIKQFSSPDTRNVFFGKALSGASSAVLQKAYSLQTCYVDAAMAVQDNKAGLSQGDGQLVAKDDVKIFPAAEIDTARYLSFATVIAPCFTGACPVTEITGFFTNYLTDSEKLIMDQLKELSTPWVKGVKTVQKDFTALADSTKSIAAGLAKAQQQATTTLNNICKAPNTCTVTNSGLARFQAEVNSFFDVAKQVTAIQGIVAGTINDVNAIVDVVEAGDKAFDAAGNLGIDGIVEKVLSGEFRNLDELAGALRAAQELPKIFTALSGRVPALQGVIGEAQNKVPTFLKACQSIFSQNWMGDFKGDPKTAQALTAQVQQVQQLIASFIPSATQAWTSVQTLSSAIGSVKGSANPGQLDLGVASYQRWTSGWFDFVCTGTQQQKYNLFGFKGSFGIPKFWACRQDYSIPFPNHHIPYLRLRLPADSILVKLAAGFDQPPPPEITTVSIAAFQTGAASPSSTSSASAADPSTTAAPESSTSSSVPSEPSSTAPADAAPSESAESSQPSQPAEPAESAGPSEQTAAFAPTTTSAAPEATGAAPADATPPLVPRLRLRIRRQESSAEGESTLFAALPSGVFTDEAEASKAATSTFASDLLFFETTSNGQVITSSTSSLPTGAPIGTTTAPDPTGTALDVPSTFDVFTDVSTAPPELASAVTSIGEFSPDASATLPISSELPAATGIVAQPSASAGADGKSGAQDLPVWPAWGALIGALTGVATLFALL